MGTIEIRDANFHDLKEIVRIHQAAFPGFLMTLMGPKFLHEYYRSILDYKNRILLAAIDSDGKVRGFVAGFIHPSDFYRHFGSRKKKMMLSAIFHVCIRPFLWFRILENVRRVNKSSACQANSQMLVAELASIAVEPKFARCGCGKKLVLNFIGSAKNNFAHLIELTTDADNNDNVNLFYQGLGFARKNIIERVDGRRMYQYEYTVRNL